MQKFQRTTAGNIAAPGSEAGFSLELAIVMVIIGLLVSGVLVGQDMIKAATLRSQLTQLSDYDTAVNTFNSKYGGIPGDYSQAAAIVAGVVSNSSTTTGEGNGNGLIESSGTDTDFGFAGEPAMFFSELSLEKLIPQSITTNTFAVGTAITIGDTTMPPAKIGGGNRVSVGTDGSYNYYLLAKYSGSTNTGTGVPMVAKGLTVSQALQIDEKIDDGIPDSRAYAAAGSRAGNRTPGLPLRHAEPAAAQAHPELDMREAVSGSLSPVRWPTDRQCLRTTFWLTAMLLPRHLRPMTDRATIATQVAPIEERDEEVSLEDAQYLAGPRRSPDDSPL